MPSSPEALCNDLARSRLVSVHEVRKLHRRWVQEAGTRAGDTAAFTRWLVRHRYVTDYQLGFLERGHGDKLFLDQYTILDRVGKGRMAGVYKAVHRLGPNVAIKILPPSKARDPQLLARFQRESRLALSLQHPNIVRTFEVGEADGLHYLVMEYLEGETLADVLRRRGKLPAAEAVRLIYQALLGLHYLHEQGLVHRDLKPGNLMLVPGPRELPGPAEPDTTSRRLLKIVDIGTGRALFADDVDEDGKPFELTNEGDLLGTPDYMAPEQARDPHTADVRADLYSLGCGLYHCLTGQPPFPDGNLVRKMMRHATEAPAPLASFHVQVPDGLQQVLDRMLAKDPAQRFPTPQQAAEALQGFLEGGSETLGTAPTDRSMRAYLRWLERRGESGSSAPTAPGRTLLASAASSSARPAEAARPAAAVPEREAKYRRKDRHRKAARRGKTPVARPAAAARPDARPVTFDAGLVEDSRGPLPAVEVPVPRGGAAVPAGAGAADAAGTRSWVWLLGAVVAGVLLAVLVCGGVLSLVVLYAFPR